MPRFTTRVELHGATREHYVMLHQQMAAQGFSDVIVTSEGKKYKLPPAEYNCDAHLTKEQVLERAKIAAGNVVRKFAVLVTESSGRTWHGLELAAEKTAYRY